MNIFNFPAAWFLQLLIIFGTYFILFFIRKRRKNQNEFKNQFIFALLFLFLCFIGEVVGVGTKLWTYFPENWPVTVWIGYYGIGLFSYQLVKLIDELTAKKKV